MANELFQLQVGDRVKFREGAAGPARRSEIGIVTAVFSDETTGAFRANVRFSDGVQPGVKVDQLERA